MGAKPLIILFLALFLTVHSTAGQLSYVIADKTPLYEKPDQGSRLIATLAAGTAVSYEGPERGMLKISMKGGTAGFLEACSLERAKLKFDFDKDGSDELFLAGLGCEPGKNSGMAVILKDNKVLASAGFDTIEDPFGRKRDLRGHKISVSAVDKKGFSPPITLIKVNYDTDHEMMYGSSYIVWDGKRLSHGFLCTGCYDPVQSLTCTAVLPWDKEGEPNVVSIKQSLDYEGCIEPDFYRYEGDYTRTVQYKWGKGAFRIIKDELKITVPKERKLKENCEE